jgi:putative ABC transport system permease protein
MSTGPDQAPNRARFTPLTLADVRWAVRSALKNRHFTVFALLTLGLAIGVNTAIFSLMYTVLLRPFPFRRSEHLVLISQTSRARNMDSFPSAADYTDWKAQSRSLAGMSAVAPAMFSFTGSAGAVAVYGYEVSYDYFELLGVRPIVGRTFVADDDRPGTSVVVIGEGLWHRAFGQDRGVVGKVIRLNSRSFTVIGVVPAFPDVAEIWKPLGWDSAASHDRVRHDYQVLARVRDGISLQAAADEMQRICQNLARSHPETDNDWVTKLTPLSTVLIGDVQTQLVLLLAAVLMVLLIGCVNLAGLFAARLNARKREIATRLALGATRGQLVRHFLTESIFLSLSGGILGVLLAFGTLPLLVTAAPSDLPRLGEVALDIPTLAFTLLLSLIAGVLFGIIPALQVTQSGLAGMLKESTRASTAGSSGAHTRDVLLVAEIALCMLLLTGAGLALRSFAALRRVDPGFRPEHVLVNTHLVLPPDRYDTPAKSLGFFAELLQRVRALPGVRSAGGSTALPLEGTNSAFSMPSDTFRIAGDSSATAGHEHGAVLNQVTEGYFETMSIPLGRGRYFEESDNSLAPHVAIVNQTLARHFFVGRNPIGQSLYLSGEDSAPWTIVGVVGDSRQFSIQAEPSPEIFVPFRQASGQYLYLLVRSTGDPEALAESVRHQVAAIDPDQPVGHRTLEQQIGNALAGPRLIAELLGLFAGLALVLALTGIYGTTSYAVAQRTQEIGIRMALGATPGAIRGMVLKRTAWVAGVGIAVGASAGLALSGLATHLLYRVRANDPLTFLEIALLMIGVALGASFIPARRASCLQVVATLREE